MDNNTSTSDDKIDSGPAQDSFGKRDTEYYFSNVVIKVENTIFRVPRNGFDVPGTTLSLPVAEGHPDIEGSSDEHPIVLPVSEESFRGFLRVIYPIKGRQMTETDWLGALELSSMWGFSEIRMKTIQELDNWIKQQHAKNAVLLAKKYRIATWLTDAYIRLLQQPTFTVGELAASPFPLDWETIARLFSAARITMLDSESDICPNCSRSRSSNKKNRCRCESFTLEATPTVHSLKIAIENEFQWELAGMRDL